MRRPTMNGGIDVSIRPYAEGDLWLLEKTLGDPGQMVHLNAGEYRAYPEASQQIPCDVCGPARWMPVHDSSRLS